MVYDRVTKAAALRELGEGISFLKVGRKYGISDATLRRWKSQDPEPEEDLVSLEPSVLRERKQYPRLSRAGQRQEFTDSFVRLALKTLEMMEVWAEECADPTFIRQRTADVNEMGRIVCAYLDRLAPIVLGVKGAGESGGTGEKMDE